MQFHGPIVRPQTDADSIFIETTIGCTYDGCTFCNFYKDTPFRTVPIVQIEEALKEAKEYEPDAKKVWLSGGNPYALETEKLAEIAKLSKKYLPGARISTYARIDDLTRKTAEDMKYLKQCGIEDIVIGVETFDDEVLKAVNKGYTVADILDGCGRLEEAGVDYRIIYLGGLAGHGKAVESARKSAKILNQLHPYMLLLTTLAIVPNTKLYEDVEAGRFEEVDERERLEEFWTLLSGIENEMTIFSATSTTSAPFIAEFPREKHELLVWMRQRIDSMTDAQIRMIEARRHRMVTV